MRTIFFIISMSVLGLSFSSVTVTQAQTVLTTAPIWSGLSSPQKDILSSLEDDWNGLSAEQRNKWLAVANRFESRPEAERDRLKSRMSEWAKLSPNDRRVARSNYLSSLDVPNEKKSEAWEAYQLLSPEEKKHLADEAAEKNKTKKPSLVNSPSLKN
jgi:hypothetical protein